MWVCRQGVEMIGAERAMHALLPVGFDAPIEGREATLPSAFASRRRNAAAPRRPILSTVSCDRSLKSHGLGTPRSQVVWCRAFEE